MSTNKHAIIRYQTLDKCFRNTGKRYYIEDLLKACNTAIFEFDPNSDGIKKRQLYDDIRFMESSQGFSIILLKIKDGRRAYYQYEDASFSINNQPLNNLEAEQLKSAILVLTRFKGLPQFKWVNELIPKLDQSFNLSEHNQDIIGFDNNPYLKGLEFIEPLFTAINNKQAITVIYQSFKHQTAQRWVYHPYYLKQHNNRWFVFGKKQDFKGLTNLALDRIQAIQPCIEPYDDSEMVDFETYFEDVIGVTKHNDVLITIILQASTTLAPYIKTKPLHGSQKKVEENENGYTFSIEVIPNYEMEKLILSFGEDLRVINPEFIKQNIKNRLQKAQQNY
ncbi:transcriptional regulator [Tamlana nanhaiensis]|uniref:Transcriptional regulator n=1 Tax=Neotamlana nanhaiensis TaxID=1382798 RepID=A0A0D7VWP3_9FLAO|nr:WYL domain-containing protein [Tamlana nanhaiensis]KJD31246.1 transcriptional regulator [Tamlana nanhaiensis]